MNIRPRCVGAEAASQKSGMLDYADGENRVLWLGGGANALRPAVRVMGITTSSRLGAMDGNSVTRALQELFEAQVINHGDYSLVVAQPCGPGPALVLGYRRTPLELVLCPVELALLPHASGDGNRVAARLAAPVSSIDLSNVGTLADTGTGYQAETVTGFRTEFEVDGALGIPVDASPVAAGHSAVVVEQVQEAEDFHQFMGHFMDVLDGFYQVPDVREILQDAYTPSVAA